VQKEGTLMDPSHIILLAEDNPDDAMLMQRAFHRQGIMRPLHIVEDGEDAIAYLAGTGIYADRVTYPFPTFVILDLKMHRVSGFGVLEWLQEHPDFRVIPTLVWSSSGDVRDVKHAYCLGANAFLCKPNDFAAFERMVHHLMLFWEDTLRPGVGPSVPDCASLQGRDPFGGTRQ
jgi:CheY-like chemotaxis protein